MALEYELELSTRMTPIQALETMANHIKGLAWGNDRFVLFDPTITICATHALNMTQKIIGRGFGFIPNLSVELRFISNSNYDRFKKLLLQATMSLLDHAQEAHERVITPTPWPLRAWEKQDLQMARMKPDPPWLAHRDPAMRRRKTGATR